MMIKEDYTVIDLFAGCGGLSLGLCLAGWNGLFAIEKNPYAFETLKCNLIEKKRHFAWPSWLPQSALDIHDVLRDYKENLDTLKGKVDLVAGGPPCQGFSMAGKRVEEDVRNQLVFMYIEFIKFVQPKMILFENVKGFTYAFDKNKNGEGEPYSKKVVDQLKEIGYDVTPHVIDFSKYGVPQRRKRFILVGTKGTTIASDKFEEMLDAEKSNFLKQEGLNEVTTLREAISDLLQSNGVEDTPDRKGFKSGVYGKAESKYQRLMRGNYADSHRIPNSHSFAHHTEAKMESYRQLLTSSVIRGKRIDNETKERCNIRQRGITILDANAIAPTITGQPDDYLHYQEPRIMTVRECARIQSFPDWYEFKMKYTTGGQMRKLEVPRYSQVGNAIPPLFAKLAGIVLKKML